MGEGKNAPILTNAQTTQTLSPELLTALDDADPVSAVWRTLAAVPAPLEPSDKPMWLQKRFETAQQCAARLVQRPDVDSPHSSENQHDAIQFWISYYDTVCSEQVGGQSAAFKADCLAAIAEHFLRLPWRHTALRFFLLSFIENAIESDGAVRDSRAARALRRYYGFLHPELVNIAERVGRIKLVSQKYVRHSELNKKLDEKKSGPALTTDEKTELDGLDKALETCGVSRAVILPICWMFPEYYLPLLVSDSETGHIDIARTTPTDEEFAGFVPNRCFLRTLNAGRTAKSDGKILEHIAAHLCGSVPGMRSRLRAVTKSTDLDVVVSIDGLLHDFRSHIGRSFTCECKDKAESQGFSVLAKMARVLEASNEQFGILFCPKGISDGTSNSDERYAERERIRLFAQTGRAILVINNDDLNSITDAQVNFLSMIRVKFEQLRIDAPTR